MFPPGEAREDWKILRALGEILGHRKSLPYDSLPDIRQRMVKTNEVFAQSDMIERAAWGEFGGAGGLDNAAFDYPIRNYYMTDPISRASATMARCTEAFVLRGRRTGTHG